MRVKRKTDVELTVRQGGVASYVIVTSHSADHALQQCVMEEVLKRAGQLDRINAIHLTCFPIADKHHPAKWRVEAYVCADPPQANRRK